MNNVHCDEMQQSYIQSWMKHWAQQILPFEPDPVEEKELPDTVKLK